MYIPIRTVYFAMGLWVGRVGVTKKTAEAMIPYCFEFLALVGVSIFLRGNVSG